MTASHSAQGTHSAQGSSQATNLADRRISVRAARLSIAAAVAVILLLASLHVLSPEFDPSWRVVSEYANGKYGWVLSLMFVAWAVSTWALAYAIWGQLPTVAGKLGLGLLVVAGLGEAMASVFDINHPLHGLSGILGIIGLPVAAMLISVTLGRTLEWAGTKKLLLVMANLTWVILVLTMAALMVMVLGRARGGTIALVGYPNRLLVVVYCVWAMTVAWQAIKVRRHAAEAQQPNTAERQS
jgi:hypothetical protein